MIVSYGWQCKWYEMASQAANTWSSEQHAILNAWIFEDGSHTPAWLCIALTAFREKREKSKYSICMSILKANASLVDGLRTKREHRNTKRLQKNTHRTISVLQKALQIKSHKVTERLNRSYDQIILKLQSVVYIPAPFLRHRLDASHHPKTKLSNTYIMTR